jgi:hypothetical protein
MSLAALLFVGISVLNVVLYYNLAFFPRLLGPQLYAMFFYALIWTQLFADVIALIGAALLVRWVLAVHEKPPPSV